MIEKFIFFLLFTFVFIYRDDLLWKCKSSLGRILFVLHHILTSLILFSGILFGWYYINIFIIIATVVSWYTYDKCILSIYHNKLCGYKKKTHFNNIGLLIRETIQDYTGLEVHYKWELVILFSIVVYNIYKIIFINYHLL